VVIMAWPSTVCAMNIIDCAIRDGHGFLNNMVLLQIRSIYEMRSGLLLLPRYID
jgi:hypothetical protein